MRLDTGITARYCAKALALDDRRETRAYVRRWAYYVPSPKWFCSGIIRSDCGQDRWWATLARS